MIKSSLPAIYILLSFTLLVSCKGDQGDPGGLILSGNMVGHTRLVYENGTLSTLGGVNVSLITTSISANSDSSGKYALNNIPQGSYDITATKPPYNSYNLFGVQVLGGGNANAIGPDIFISKPSTTRITSVIATTDGTYFHVVVNAAIPDSTSSKTCVLFLSSSNTVNINSYTTDVYINGSNLSGLGITTLTGLMADYPQFKSSLVYGVVYSIGGYPYSVYYDPYQGRNIYTSFNTFNSAVFKIQF